MILFISRTVYASRLIIIVTAANNTHNCLKVKILITITINAIDVLCLFM